MKKYFVIAERWSEEKKETVKYIAGEFDEFMNALIFKEAYNERYKATAEIRELDA